MTRPIFRGRSGALRLGVAGVKGMADWDEFPPWRRFFNALMTREKGPVIPEKLNTFKSRRGYRNGRLDANGTWWSKDTRKQFDATLPDEVLERLGGALGLNVSFPRIEVVLIGDALNHTQPDLEPAKDVDAYVLFIENSSDLAQVRRLFAAHDQDVISHHFHATKWAIRHGDADLRCDYDVLRQAFDRTVRAEGSLTAVNWREDEWKVLAKYELRSLKPVLFVVNVSRDEYVSQV
ncbi:hypothetical protein AAVH_14108 [Aphelenchoides avenae]|nr:hypothetical protein AAVH_14108 [Aphelenchus avenae]